MNYEIAIPSYRRSKKLRSQTLDYLASECIDPQRITIFVADEDERKEYEKVLLPDSYGRLVVGHLGLAEQRNFIHSWYPIGTKILFIDDDIKNLKWISSCPLDIFVQQMFRLAEQEGVNLWSIQPASTLLFCKDRIRIGKMFCVGCFYGQVNTEDAQIPCLSACEDKYRSLYRYKTDGKTMRYDGCCPNTTYFSKGGLSEYRKTRQHLDTVEVCKMFEGECSLKKKKNGVSECYWKQVCEQEYILPNFTQTFSTN